ncbi:hypothetical protein L596_012772 [Steinernema carpocapsae]|uniref:Uncharacterized protein n=1 Tax=Steinernema carpocapsae TaxID=34508 RepID=A0A4U5NY37_STECR|nr:hypothetical protein L596_012772 [Steinernema carpocapsae]
MSSLFLLAASQLSNTDSPISTSICGYPAKFVQACRKSRESFLDLHSSKVPKDCFAYTDRAKVDNRRMIQKAKNHLSPRRIFKLKCATGDISDLASTWKLLEPRTKKRFLCHKSVFYWYNALFVDKELLGNNRMIPNWAPHSFTECAKNGWNDAAQNMFGKLNEDEQQTQFLKEYQRKIQENDDFELIRQILGSGFKYTRSELEDFDDESEDSEHDERAEKILIKKLPFPKTALYLRLWTILLVWLIYLNNDFL